MRLRSASVKILVLMEKSPIWLAWACLSFTQLQWVDDRHPMKGSFIPDEAATSCNFAPKWRRLPSPRDAQLVLA